MSVYICPYTCSYRTNAGHCGMTGGYENCQYIKYLEKLEKEKTNTREINDAPTVDAVEVVRCVECKWWFKDENYDGLYRCANDGLLRKEDHYCACGERKNDE